MDCENELFNTLKNQGYHFEHNYGHGKQHLATNFAILMLLAFFIDQIQSCCCQIYQAARAKNRTKVSFLNKMEALFLSYFVLDWESFYFSVINGWQGNILTPCLNKNTEVSEILFDSS